MKDLVKAVLEKAGRSLKSAEREFQQGNLDFSCSKAYFVAIYLLKGVLLLDGYDFILHRDIVALFRAEYVNKGLFSVAVLQHVKYLQKRRELADFSFTLPIYTKEAQQCLLRAKQVYLAISPYLQDKLYKMQTG